MKKYFGFLVAIALSAGFISCSDNEEDSNKIPVLQDDIPSAVVPANGFYIANEDWFGHDNGTVNYFKNDGTIVYRAYRAVNAGETFGVTTQYATIWGEYAYFVSKQGNRLVVADAETLKKKAVFTDLGGDGRAFTGVDDKIGYISLSNGICQFNITELKLGARVEGISEQIGTMCYANGNLYAVSPSKVYIIDVATNSVKQTLTGSFNTLTQSKDGTIWIAASDKFIKLNPVTLETEDMPYPENMSVGSSWGAWNAGSLCASTQKNVLYWTKLSGSGWSAVAKTIVKYDIDSKSFNANLFELGLDEGGKQQVFYGAGIRINPLTDEIIVTSRRTGYGDSYSYNWVYKLTADGQELSKVFLLGDNGLGTEWGEANGQPDWDNRYYWFPSIPFFEDANKPEILTNQILLSPGETKTIDLTEKIIDADNISVSVIRKVEFVENDLVTYSLKDNVLTVTAKEKVGSTECKMIAISNGKKIEKKVRVDVTLDK